MHSFITGNLPHIPNTPDVLTVSGESSIGIDQVRDIQHFLANKPFQSQKNIVIINDAHLLTIPAQNAILKTLEEPPGNSEIYLVTSQPDLLLPTILSRCQLIKSQTITPADLQLNDLISQFLNYSTISERLILLDSQSFTRESLAKFLDAFELYIHENLNNPLVIGHWNLVIEARKYLRANCSLRLLTTHIAHLQGGLSK